MNNLLFLDYIKVVNLKTLFISTILLLSSSILYFYINSTEPCNGAISPRDSFAHTTDGNWLYILGGYGANKVRFNDFLQSKDGANWETVLKADFEPRNMARAVMHDGAMFLIGGHTKNPDGTFKAYSDVWKFQNGILTKLTDTAPFGQRVGFALASHQGYLYVIGGMNSDGLRNSDSFPHFGDVWRSIDGIKWEKLDVSFEPRANMDAVSFNDQLYIFAGGLYGTDVRYNHVINVLSGEVLNSNLPSRYFHRAIEFNNQIVVLGGFDTGNLNDVWVTDNLSFWQEMPEPPWSKRHEQGVYIQNNSLKLFGGLSNDNPPLKSDLWVTTDLKEWTNVCH